MAFTVEIPNLAGSPALTAVFFASKQITALAQVSGGAVGFDLFTPAADCTYVLLIRVQDVATGTPSHATVDVVTLSATTGWAPTKMLTSVTNVGTCATTYSNNLGALKLAVGSGTTWYADVVVLARFPA